MGDFCMENENDLMSKNQLTLILHSQFFSQRYFDGSFLEQLWLFLLRLQLVIIIPKNLNLVKKVDLTRFCDLIFMSLCRIELLNCFLGALIPS